MSSTAIYKASASRPGRDKASQDQLRSIEMNKYHKAACHCGAVELELRLPDGITETHRCNCSMCSKRGALVATLGLENLKVIKGADLLSLYQFNTFTAKHYFCSVCGIYTHHQRRSNPLEFSFNVACVEGVSPFDFKSVVVLNGINHACDRKSDS